MRWKTSVVPLLVLLCVPTHATAQKPADSFDRLQASLRRGDVVYVEDARAGEQVKGKVIEISLASLTVDTRSGAKAFQPDQVRQITRVDRRLNGFLLGQAVGAGVGAWAGWGYVNQLCVNEVGACPGQALAVAATTSLVGGWIGWEIDSRIEGKTLVFARVSF